MLKVVLTVKLIYHRGI